MRTRRLELVAMTLPLVEAELVSSAQLGVHLEATVPPAWPPGEYDRDALEFFRRKFVEEGRSELDWCSFYVIAREHEGMQRVLVAAAGYHGPPDDAGDIELGYSVVEDARGRGYAIETVLALIENALASPIVKRVVANTSDANPASIAVLEKCGFVRKRGVGEPDSIRFERMK